MSISLSKKPSFKTYQSDFASQLVRRMIADAASCYAPTYEQDPDDAFTDRQLARGHIPYFGVPAVSELSPTEIDAAIKSDNDPWSQDMKGGRQPNLDNLSVRTLLCALQFAQIVPTADEFSDLYKAGNLTFLTVPDLGKLAQVIDDIDDIVFAGKAVATPNASQRSGLRIVACDLRFSTASGKKQTELRSSFAGKVDEAVADGCAVLVIASNLQLLSSEARIVMSKSLTWPSITQDLILQLLTLTHSATGMIARDAISALLPPDALLNTLPPTLLAHALQAPTTISVAKRLADYACASSTTQPANSLSLRDLKGVPHVTRKLADVVADLNDWKDGKVEWSDINASILLTGPAGTGKTMAAAALAGSAGVSLISTSFTDLQKSGHLGDYLRAMSEVVDEAISCAPSVIFFDELDSFGTRGGSTDRNDRYWSAAINDFLQQLTRLNAAPGVIVVAATNHPDKIDPAIKRSGRFDIKIALQHPDKSGVRDILSHHLSCSCLAQNDLESNLVDNATVNQLLGLSGADLAFVARDAKGRARRAKTALSRDHVRQAAYAVTPPADDTHLKRIASHEAGHIVVAACLGLPLPILATMSATDGMVQRIEPSVFTPDSIKLEQAYLLGGRAAEMLLCGDISSGSGGAFGSDLDCATSLALSQETGWGLGDAGLMFAPIATNGRHAMSASLRRSVNQRLAAAEELALTTLTANIDLLKTVTHALLQSRELDQKQIANLVAATPSPQPPSLNQPTACTL